MVALSPQKGWNLCMVKHRGKCWDGSLGRYPVYSPDLMVEDQSVHDDFKNGCNGLYDQWEYMTHTERHSKGRFVNMIRKT